MNNPHRTAVKERHRDAPVKAGTTIAMIGALSLALAMGIGRFAFTPLLPLMQRDASIDVSAGAWLAASNYLGYLVGAGVVARYLSSPVRQIKISLSGIALTTILMGLTQALPLWLGLRFIAGMLSAQALVATSTWTMQELARTRQLHLTGVVYGGVGAGIALAGTFCLIGARPGISAAQLWIGLGLLTLVLSAPIIASIRADSPLAGMATPSISRRAIPRDCRWLVIHYGIFGFGYILPATFIPALARNLIDDPQQFGLAWPLFGVAAFASTLGATWLLRHRNRLRVWSLCHGLMAMGALLPSLSATLWAVMAAALLVGGTFMIATMVGLQEARARAPDAVAALLGRMTAAFALGQLAGPVASALINHAVTDRHAALAWALQAAAVALVLSAAGLWWMSSRRAQD